MNHFLTYSSPHNTSANWADVTAISSDLTSSLSIVDIIVSNIISISIPGILSGLILILILIIN